MSSDGFSNRPASVPLSWLFAVALVVMMAAAGLWGYILVTRPSAVQQPTVTPVFVVITPERTPMPSPTTATPDAAEAGPTPTFPPPPAGSLIKLDAYVQVVNTGGGLRMRYEPGLLSEVNYLAVDYEVFVVEDGPREANGMTWWFLVAQADERRNGWAASNYLQVVR